MGKKKKMPTGPFKENGKRKMPIPVRIAAGDANDKFSEYPSNGLTPKRLAAIFREADEGNVRRQMELFEEMEEKDPHLFSQLQTRKLAVTGLDWEVQAFSEEEQDRQIAEFISEQLKRIENLDDIFLDMLDAIGKGLSVMEIQWGISSNGDNIIKNIEYVHPKKIIWDSVTDELKVCTKESPAGMVLPENKFVLHHYKAKSGHPSRAGILRIVAWMYLFKNYDIKDWVAFCEIFGMPLRLGKYNASASEDDKKALMDAIVSLGTDAAGIIPDSTLIEFIESQKTTSVDIYERLPRYCDEQISKAILGQTLTSDSGGGSYAQSKTHDEVRHDLTVADAKALAVTVRRDIIHPLVLYNFGSAAEQPFFTFDCQEVADQKETVDIYKTLACEMGLEIPKRHIYKKFNIPKPEEGEEVLNPQLYTRINMMKNADEKEEKALKAIENSQQGQIDRLTEAATKQAVYIFEEMFQPILKMIDKTDSLEALRNTLKNGNSLKELYQELENPDLEEMVKQGLYLSHLIGRAVD